MISENQNNENNNHDEKKRGAAESYETYSVKEEGRVVFKRVKYDFRTEDGCFFSTVAGDLETCRHKRDLWLSKKGAKDAN